MNSINIPELLAPVGGWQQLKAAVQNGADAVYMGGPLFNARIKAENFGAGRMKEAIDYAHSRNVKVYITINTLIRDDELFKVLSYINELYGMGADAVILQDMGLARLVKKYLPDMPMHLSTQGTVYNKEAAGLVKELGFCRVVPARELTLEEIRLLAAECHSGGNPCQVEVFVHGALCMCYSGQCQMSRILGGVSGRSGNRGLCAQPCRLPYEDGKGNRSYLLSPKDICMLEDIPQLCKAGVDSFKIEGRLKSPQYVAVVTSIYRKYLDQYRDEGHVKAQVSDMQRLTQIFNRGGFSKGYLFGNPGEDLLSGESPKNQGVCVGTVKSVKKGSPLVDVKPEEKQCFDGSGNGGPPQESLSMGDGVEIRGRGTAGNVVTYLKKLPDGAFRIGDIKEQVFPGDKVFKVTDKKLLEEAEASYSDDNSRKIPVEMSFRAVIGEPPELHMREIKETAEIQGASGDADDWIKVKASVAAEKAINRALDEERAARQLSKLGDTIFQAERIAVEMEPGISLPVSVLNSMRREASKQLVKPKCRIERTPLTDEALAEIRRRELTEEDENINHSSTSVYHLYHRKELDSSAWRQFIGRVRRGDADRVRREDAGKTRREDAGRLQTAALCIPIRLYLDEAFMGNVGERADVRRADLEILPYVLNVSKGNLDKWIEDNFSAICDKVRDTGVLVGNLGWIKQFREAGIKVYGDYGLNVYNRQSRKAFEELGVDIRVWSHEAEMFFFRNIPLMITEHPIPYKTIKDRKGKKYTILRSDSMDKYLIFQGIDVPVLE